MAKGRRDREIWRYAIIVSQYVEDPQTGKPYSPKSFARHLRRKGLRFERQ